MTISIKKKEEFPNNFNQIIYHMIYHLLQDNQNQIINHKSKKIQNPQLKDFQSDFQKR